MEDYGFEYSDDEYAEEDVDIENQYYNSKGALEYFHSISIGGSNSVIFIKLRLFLNYFLYAGLIESNELKEALPDFKQVLTMEEDKGEW